MNLPVNGVRGTEGECVHSKAGEIRKLFRVRTLIKLTGVRGPLFAGGPVRGVDLALSESWLFWNFGFVRSRLRGVLCAPPRFAALFPRLRFPELLAQHLVDYILALRLASGCLVVVGVHVYLLTHD